jgi:predicted DNA-binding transcriptional regulator YafY
MLLLERGHLKTPMRQEILQKVSQPTEPWRIVIEQYRSIQQPFHLIYLNSQQENHTYTVRYAQINFEEKRFYLNIWCDETEDIKETNYPELIHNRCLRLDRIQSLVPLPGGEWHSEGLSTIEVQLHFYRDLVKSYESKENDVENEVVDEVRRVTRRVFNPFWLLREVRRYGSDCEVISPEALRQQAWKDAQAVCDRYQREVKQN